MKKILLMLSTVMAMGLHADLASDTALLFSTIEASVQDSLYAQANNIMIPYKKFPEQMRLLLSATKVVDGVASTTPLHVAASASRDNYGITGVIFQKASVVPNYQAFARQLANACDALGRKPKDVADDPNIITFLNHFTDATIVCPTP